MDLTIFKLIALNGVTKYGLFLSIIYVINSTYHNKKCKHKKITKCLTLEKQSCQKLMCGMYN
jgi:hypothetical protein